MTDDTPRPDASTRRGTNAATAPGKLDRSLKVISDHVASSRAATANARKLLKHVGKTSPNG